MEKTVAERLKDLADALSQKAEEIRNRVKGSADE